MFAKESIICYIQHFIQFDVFNACKWTVSRKKLPKMVNFHAHLVKNLCSVKSKPIGTSYPNSPFVDNARNFFSHKFQNILNKKHFYRTWALSQLLICRPPPRPSEMVILTWKMLSTWKMLLTWKMLCWNGWKINFPIYIFRVMIILVLKIWSISDEFPPITRKIKIAKKIYFDFSFYSAHSASFIKIWPPLGGGEGGSSYP